MSGVGEDDNKGMVSDIEGMWSLGGGEMSRSIRDGICVFVAVVVVVVVALMVASWVVVLMAVVGIVVLVTVVRISCIGVLGVVGVLCGGTLEVDCVGVVGILVLDGVFAVEMAEGVELVVGCVVRLILWCVNRRGYFFVSLQSEVGENEGIKCRWVPLWDGDLGALFCPFGTGFFGQDGRYGHVDGFGG